MTEENNWKKMTWFAAQLATNAALICKFYCEIPEALLILELFSSKCQFIFTSKALQIAIVQTHANNNYYY